MTKTPERTLVLIIITIIITLYVAWTATGIKKNILPLRMNIFDEIYYDTRNNFDHTNGARLSDINRIDTPKYGGLLGDSGPSVAPEYNYENNNIPETYYDISVSVSAAESNHEILFISLNKHINGGKLYFSNRYNAEDHTLTQRVSVEINDLHENRYSYPDREAQDFLAQHNITPENLDSYNEAILNNVVLTDWTTVYNSRFSPDNYGDVEVTKQW